MKKRNLQEDELKQVAGGADHNTHPTCKSCGKAWYTAEHDNSCIYVPDGCEAPIKRYTCPFCGFQWEED